MTDTTIQTYVENFEKYIEKTPNIVSGDYKLLLDKFCDLISDEKKVFELGSAFLRDSKYMRDKGLIVTCSDVIPQTLELAKKENFAVQKIS